MTGNPRSTKKRAMQSSRWNLGEASMPSLTGRHSLQGAELKGIRAVLHLNQPELAKLIDVSVSTISALEGGEGKIIGPALKLLELLIWLPEDQRKAAIARLISNPHTTPT